MKAFQNKIIPGINNKLITTTSRNYGKRFKPTFYNLRLYYSNLQRNFLGLHKWDNIHAPEGFEKTKTDRNPNNYKYKLNLIHHTVSELKHIYGDWLYQIYKRSHRMTDPFMTYVLPTAVVGSYLLFPHHLFFKTFFIFSSCSTVSRIFNKGDEPHLDEIWLRDFLLKHETVGKYLKFDTHHVIDCEMEFDKGHDNPYFPETRTRLNRFFNNDSNTTTGFYKFGDLETGAIVTVHFKTMPISSSQYWFSDPFFVYDMVVEINDNGKFISEHVIKANEVLQHKKIFVPLF